MKLKNKIVVVGLGYIGLPFAMILAENGHDVCGYDIDENKINSLKSKKYFFDEKNLNKLKKKTNVLKNLSFSNKLDKGNIYILCLPTPLNKNNNCDYKFIYKALDEISKIIKKSKKKSKNRYLLCK